jgi:aminoglycoside N3'-acetyltransferase
LTSPAIRRWHGEFGSAELRDHLRDRLPPDFDVLMVHSSLNALYPTFQGGFNILSILLDLVGDNRTLAMPAFFLGGKSYLAEEAYRLNPVFDEAKTPSEMGLVTELFRRLKGVRRSLHPTHSICARGPLADALVATHHTCGSTFGIGSPFEIMNRHKTVILGIGTHYFRVLTHVHTAEDLLGEAYPLRLRSRPETPMTLIARDGRRYPYVLRLTHADPQLYSRRSEMLRTLMPKGALQEWVFHGVPMFTADAATVTSVLLREAERGRTLYVPARRSGRRPNHLGAIVPSRR